MIYVCTAKKKKQQLDSRVRVKPWSTTSAQPFWVSWQRRIWCECSLTLPLQAVPKIAQPNQCFLDFNCTSCYQIIFLPVYFSIPLWRGEEEVCCDCQLIFYVFVIKITEELCNSLYLCLLLALTQLQRTYWLPLNQQSCLFATVVSV